MNIHCKIFTKIIFLATKQGTNFLGINHEGLGADDGTKLLVMTNIFRELFYFKKKFFTCSDFKDKLFWNQVLGSVQIFKISLSISKN